MLGGGTIGGEDADESLYSVVVMAISSDELRWRNGLARGLGADSRAVGQQVAQSLSSDISADSVGLFVFPDGYTANVDQFLAGLEGDLSSDQFLPIWGGCAGENIGVLRTCQYSDDDVVSDGVAYALLSGEAQPSWDIGIGYVLIGSERMVTRSQGNVIYEIDEKPALDVFQEYVPDSALADNWGSYSTSFALCFRAPSYMKDQEYVFRVVVPSVNKADGSANLQIEVKEGTSVWFSSRDKKMTTAGLDQMAEQINQQLGGTQPKLVFHFDCAARGKVMFREQEKLQLLKEFRQSVGPEVPWAVFYTSGEIGPVGKHNCYHNYTAVVLALR